LKKIFVILLVVFCAAAAVAQDAPKGEVFGGYQFFSVDTKGSDRISMHGWNADVAFNATKNLGIVADIGGAYKSESVTIGGVTTTGKLRVYNYLFGPRFSARGEKFTPFAEALFGMGHASASGSVSGLGSGSDSINGFAMAFGGGFDINAGQHFAIRPAKFDYVLNRFSDSGISENLNNFRYAAGVVIKF
jgi:hypothetical protein